MKGLQCHFPLRIFMTSRKLSDMIRLTRLLDGCDIGVVDIPASDTMRDIDLYVRSRILDLPIESDEERDELTRRILSKSDTSFLWVRLVMDELEGIYGYDSIIEVLQGIPEGMVPYYGRVVDEMGENKREKHVAKAILLWVVLATRPLSVSELSHALLLDNNIRLPSAKAAIEGLCGQLVIVDVHSGLVQPVHATAREFILSEAAGEFRVLKSQGHEKIALICLRLLTGADMQPPRHRRLLGQKKGKSSASALTDYAIMQFSEHVLNASTESDELLLAMDKLLRTTVLTWIEKVMMQKDIHHLVRTAKNLKAYLDRRAKYHSPLNRHVNTIEAWATDLTRVASSFGRALIRSPQSVYFLIPPLCPTQTAIFRQFARTPDGLAISGCIRSDWSDCVANIHFEDETAAAVGCGNNLIAIGLECGIIDLYSSRSFQKKGVIEIQSAVERIHFDPSGSFVAVASRKFVGIWNTDGTLRWKKRVRSRFMLLSSSQDALIGITPQGHSFQWDINSGDLVQEQSYHYQSPDSDADDQMTTSKAPSAASVSFGLELLALCYRNSPICIFECNTGSLIAWAIDEKHRAAEQVIFNPNPDVSLLLVAYNESHLALYDSWSGNLIEDAEAESHVILNSVTCSSDGRTFAAVDVRGHLRVWDFESLTLLYHVLTPIQSFSLLQFTSDGLGLVHVVDHEMRVWAPSVLVRKTMEEEASLSDQSPILSVTEGQFEKFQASKIKTLIAHPLRPCLFAGKYNGEVVLFQSSSDFVPSTLYSHDGVVVKCLALSKSNIIASADIHGHVWVRQFDLSQPASLQSDISVFEKNFSTPIVQLLFDASDTYLLISTLGSDGVYRISDGSCIGTLPSQAEDRNVFKWFIAPELGYEEHFLLLNDHAVKAYSIGNFSEPPKTVCEFAKTTQRTSIESITHLSGTSYIIVETQDTELRTSTSVYDLPSWHSPKPDTASDTRYAISADVCAKFLGVSRANKRLMLLQPDSWICSVDLKDLDKNQCLEHCFVPEEYGSLNNEVKPVQTVDGDFAFCLYDKVVVIKGGSKFEVRKDLV
jgi:WD40 repeat protein